MLELLLGLGGVPPAVLGAAGAQGRDALVARWAQRAYRAGLQAPQDAFSGNIYRTVDSQFARTALDHRWSARAGGRYNNPGERLLYASPTPQQTLAEHAAYGSKPGPGMTTVELRFDGEVANVSDNLRSLGLRRSALAAPKGGKGPSLLYRLTGEDPYMLPRAVARGARESGAHAVKVPSAVGGDQIDVFPENVKPRQLRPTQTWTYSENGSPTSPLPADGHVDPMPHGKAPNPENFEVLEQGRTRRAGAARYAALGALGASGAQNLYRWAHGDLDAGTALGNTAVDAGLGTMTGLAQDGLAARFGGGTRGALKAGALVDAVASGAFSTWDNAKAYQRGDVSASQATANVLVDTGIGVGSGLAGMAAGAAIGSVVPVAGTAVGALLGFLAGTAAGWLTSSLAYGSGFADWAKSGLGGWLAPAEETLSGVWDGISTGVGWVSDTASSIGEGIASAAGSVGNAISSAWDALTSWW